jgi:cell division protein FtsZ
MNELPLEQQLLTDQNIAIKLVGIGGAGSNAVDRLKMDNLDRVQLAVINTDLQALSSSPVQEKVMIGSSITRGLGAGGDPDLGREAAEADRAKIAAVVKDQDLVFVVAGMGGGTGTGAASVVAEAAMEEGALVIAFVTMPFSFEGGRRLKQAEEGLQALRRVCDAVIPLPNNVLLQEAAENESVLDSFARADDWIGRGVKAIWAMLSRTGMINVDFSTLRQAFQTRGGKTFFGLGSGTGEFAAAEAIKSLNQCPLLAATDTARRADRLLVNITGGPDLATAKVNEIMQALTEEFGMDCHVIMGATIDESMKGRVELVVLGTTDIASRGRGVTARAPSSSSRQRSAAKAQETEQAPKSEASEPGAVPAAAAPEASAAQPSAPAGKKAEPADKDDDVAQNEFTFSDVDSRGHFENTDRNLFEGQDLDVPTYMRKGIKLML